MPNVWNSTNEFTHYGNSADNYAKLLHTEKFINDDDDILIGSLAIEYDAVLVTSNTRHLERLDGIRLENWREELE